ncbi:uncharacterized protein MYCGRDRAFT_82939, partial [Zymoseptoria tritici IPO323]
KKKKEKQSTLPYTRTSSKSEPKSHLVHFKELEQSVESTTLRLTCVAVCVWKRHAVLQRRIEDKRGQRVGQLLCFCTTFRICSVRAKR